MRTGIDLLDDHLATDLWPVVCAPPPWANLTFLMGARSSRWRDPHSASQVRKLLASTPDNVAVGTLQGGHWIHVDDPAGTEAAVIAALG